MKTFALIEPSGRVAQVEKFEPTEENPVPFPVAEPFVWLECDDTVTADWHFDGEVFAPPASAE